MKITAIDEYSTGMELGFLPGDKIRTINGRKVRDILDYRFYIADEAVEIEIEREKDRIFFEVEKDIDDTLGLNFEPIKVRMCGNDCPFCFVDQNPAGMRKTMYFRDEDFRLSFLAGHFVTLTNISKRDLERIVEQRLTPLYISVHAIDLEIRKFLLGLKKDDHLLDKMTYLTDNGITLHTQIVVCPGVNDGKVLDETVAALSKYFPRVGSIAAVPLGLTRHRDGLTKLQPVTAEYAKRFLEHADNLGEKYRKELGMFFIYPSDEFYIRSGGAIPERERYDTFEQFENGVGMVRTLLDEFETVKEEMPDRLHFPVNVSMLTGEMMHEILEKEIISEFRNIKNLQINLVKVQNDFYGHTIRTTGLLTGQDIYKNCRDLDLGQKLYLPGNCVNDKMHFLDDWTLGGLSEKLGIPIEVSANDFGEILEDIKRLGSLHE